MIIQRCDICHEYAILRHVVQTLPYSCKSCQQIKSKPDRISHLREQSPGSFPEELRGFELSFVEEQLIALVHVNQYVYLRKTGSIEAKG